jgi:outer membrane protein TolC
MKPGILSALAAALAAAGCVSMTPDHGFSAVEQVASEKLQARAQWAKTPDEAASLRAEVDKRLAAPLAAEDAVQIALWNNPGLQASYAELKLSEADLVAAGRLPGIRLSALRTTADNIGPKIEQLIGFNLLSLLTIPSRIEAQRARIEGVKVRAAGEMLSLASATRRAWVDAVATQQALAYAHQVREAAQAGAELAERMERAGNFSRLARLKEHGFYADAQAQLARADVAAVAARERLTRLMGLGGDRIAYRLPERLPDIPAAPLVIGDAIATAMRERLDVRAARSDADALASSLGLTRATRWVNAIDLAAARTREGFEPARRGWDIGIEVPLFDFGSARNATAEALYMQGVARIAETAVNAQSEVREAYHLYRSAHDLARHYRKEVVPLAQKTSEETLLRYNGMLASVFDLLADAREQVASVNAALAAERDYWKAEAELRMALAGKPAGTTTLSTGVRGESARAGH